MYYVSTRNKEDRRTAAEAIAQGLAADGGLMTPEVFPKLCHNALDTMRDMSYQQRAVYVMNSYLDDFTASELSAYADKAYGGEKFDVKEVAPVRAVDENTYCLELWHGPTSAFKDMALQCLPRFFSASAAQLREQGKLDHDFLILVATSGDTGKAALEGFRDVDGVSIGVMYPDGGVSDIQFKQMATQRGRNVQVWGVRGNFDDCQTGAKNVFGDEAFAKKLQDEHRIALSSANSINWGRLMPQIVYYVSAYAQLAADGKLNLGDELDVCVPTGNFGNILAAYYAKRMGVPLGMLYCASNENRVLTDFINTGTYDISERPFVLTPSPSMDILVSSNLERQLFELTGRDAAAIAGWMADLKQQRCFRVDEDTFKAVRKHFAADSVDNAECLRTIKEVLDKHDYLLDPHTAVAYRAAQNLRGENPVLIASTAHWAKFGNNVYRALHDMQPGQPLPENVAALSGCGLNDLVADESGHHDVPRGLAELDGLPIRFAEVIDGTTKDIESATERFLAALDNE